jgi:deoxyribose-phosphate aldolase
MDFPVLPVQKKELSELTVHYIEESKKLFSPDMLRLAFSCIDLTSLNSTDTVSHIAAFVHKVNHFQIDFPGFRNVSAICVYPNMISVVKENLAAEEVRIASVAGGFPSSMTFGELKAEEARQAVIHGADEIDIVLPLWAFLDKNADYCQDEIRSIKRAIGDSHLKVILETGILQDPEIIWHASLLSLDAGADFIKTSTGKTGISATPEAAVIMCKALEYWNKERGEVRGFKPAGGIVNSSDALVYLAIVKGILGDRWLNNRYFRIGASRLANNLLSDILERNIIYF